eukprot:329520-Chlamydomonas_euryale.AAC.9
MEQPDVSVHLREHASGFLAMNGCWMGTPESATPGQHWKSFWASLEMPGARSDRGNGVGKEREVGGLQTAPFD